MLYKHAFMDTSWEDAQTFLAIAEAGSFSGGAKRLGLGQPTLSRRIAGMEERLGTQLFTRGKRGAALTEAGARLLPAAEQMARWATEFDRLARGSEERPAGTVRIAAPPGISVDLLAPFASQVGEAYPEIHLEIRAGIEHLDLTRGGADLALRTRPPNEPELMTLAQQSVPIGIFATPQYKARLEARLAEANKPIELADIDWVTWSAPMEHVAPRPMLARAIPDFQPIFASDDYLVLRAAVVSGLGAMPLDRVQIPGTPSVGLVEIDLGFELPENAFYLVCAKSMRFVPRVRVVADLLIERLSLLAVAPATPSL